MREPRGETGAASETILRRGTVRRSSFLLFLAGLLYFLPSDSAAVVIEDYRPCFHAYLESDGTVRVAWRRFLESGVPHVLVVDPVRMELGKVNRRAIEGKPAADGQWETTPFAAALARYCAPPHPLRNAGILRAEEPSRGYLLTVDLCPSRRPLDRKLFREIAGFVGEAAASVPVGIAASGLWIRNHREDFRWLVDLGRSPAGRLRITWINHSYSHPYDPAAPLEKNFLLRPGSDLLFEILEAEKTLLQHDLLPAPFFRFPGLVSDGRLVEALREKLLLPVGAGAWMGKGEPARPGDIILVHGNGNEPKGVRELYRLLDRLRAEGSRTAAFLPLASAVTGRPAP